ncbi:MAG: hypothetical protein OES46_19195 [Gammaproteobacteria bacterium]|nr:hypothetical protein [Gammaproteobacteria bacterium]
MITGSTGSKALIKQRWSRENAGHAVLNELTNAYSKEDTSSKTTHRSHDHATRFQFGSGFLIVLPIRNGAVVKYSVFAIALVCAPTYCLGDAIRFKVKNIEPLLEKDESGKTTQLRERSSHSPFVGPNSNSFLKKQGETDAATRQRIRT